MPITIYPGTVKKRNANGTYSDLIPGSDAYASEIEELQDIAGDGQLSGFTATDLTGAANELKNTLNQLNRNMAYVESGNTASRTYAAGDYISWKGTLYRASTAIPSGSTFSVGGNLTAASSGGLNDLATYMKTAVDITSSVVTDTTKITVNSVKRIGNIVAGQITIISDVLSSGLNSFPFSITGVEWIISPVISFRTSGTPDSQLNFFANMPQSNTLQVRATGSNASPLLVYFIGFVN